MLRISFFVIYNFMFMIPLKIMKYIGGKDPFSLRYDDLSFIYPRCHPLNNSLTSFHASALAGGCREYTISVEYGHP